MSRQSFSKSLSLHAIQKELRQAYQDLLKIFRNYLPPHQSTLAWILQILVIVNLLSLLFPKLIYCTANSLLNGAFWQVCLAPWTVPPSSSIWPLFLLILISYQASGLATGRLLNTRPFWQAGLAWLILSSLNLFLNGLVWSVVMSGAMWCWFGSSLRTLKPTSRSKLQKGLFISIIVGTISGALYLILFPTKAVLFTGDQVMIRPLLTTWGYRMGPHAVPLIKIKGFNLKWVILLFCLFETVLMPSATTFAGLVSTVCLCLWWEGPKTLFLQFSTKFK